MKFRLPVISGSYEGRTVLTDKDARPIGLLRWGWRQQVAEDDLENHLKVISKVIHHQQPFQAFHGFMDSSWLNFHKLNH